MRRIFIPLFLCLGLFLLPLATLAQDGDDGEPTNTTPIPKVHVVQAGETLSSIADLYGITVDDLILVNNLTNPEFLFEGQELFIPGQVGDAAAALYTVQMGDTLASIAAAFNTTAPRNRRPKQPAQPPVNLRRATTDRHQPHRFRPTHAADWNLSSGAIR